MVIQILQTDILVFFEPVSNRAVDV